MKRARTATVAAALVALSLTATACGRDAASHGAEAQSGPIDDGLAKGTIDVWAMGTEGDELQKFSEAFEKANPDADVKVTAIPWEAAHDKLSNAIAAGRGARRQPGRHHVDGRVRRGRRADADAEGPGRRVRLLPRRVGVDRGRRHVVRRPLVRRDPGPLLPHRPREEGRLGPGAAELGRAAPVRPGPQGQGRRRLRPEPPARPDRLLADHDAVRLVQRRVGDQRRGHRVHASTPRR